MVTVVTVTAVVLMSTGVIIIIIMTKIITYTICTPENYNPNQTAYIYIYGVYVWVFVTSRHVYHVIRWGFAYFLNTSLAASVLCVHLNVFWR